MPKHRLPIGIQTFRQIRDEDCYYHFRKQDRVPPPCAS